MNYFIYEARNGRFSHELHAFRGVAALVVFLFHLKGRALEAFPDFIFPSIFNGSAAVTFFFVLSGLVVGMSLGKSWGRAHFLLDYGIKRVFRIMPLMFVMTTIGGLYLFFINARMPYPLYEDEFGDFSVTKWIAGYIGYSLKANPPSWSIFVELVGSAALPLFILTARSRLMMVASIVALTFFTLLDFESQHRWHFYMISFYAGLSILYWGKSFVDFINKFHPSLFWGLVIVLAAAFYLPRAVLDVDFFGNPWMPLWETFIITPLVALIYYIPERFSIMQRKPFQFLGDISFSLYLIHMILMTIVYNLVILTMGANVLALFLFVVATIPLTLFISHLSYQYLERPFISMGKKALPIVSRFVPKTGKAST